MSTGEPTAPMERKTAGRNGPWVLVIILIATTIASSIFLAVESSRVLAQQGIRLSSMEIARQAMIHVAAAGVVPAVWWAARKFRMDRLLGPVLLWLALTTALGLSMTVAVNYL